MAVYSFDKEYAVETKKTVNIGGQVQTLNFTDAYIKKVNKVGIAIESVINQLDVDTSKMSKQSQDKLIDNLATKLRDTAIDGLNKLLDGRGQELYNHYGQSTNVLINIIRFIQDLSADIVKDQKAQEKSK